MKLGELQNTWDTLGSIDPMWAILTDDTQKLGNKWKQDEFFKTGEVEVDEVMRHLSHLIDTAVPNRKALDFGCGIGRLTRALARHFTEVVGVDIAPSMIENARKLNADEDHCRWVLNETDDLQVFPSDSFDFVYSNITLQHMKPQHAASYLREFVRILRSGGAVVFQLPDRPPRDPVHLLTSALVRLLPYMPRPIIDAYRRVKYRAADNQTLRKLPRVLMEMYGMERRTVSSILQRAGAKVLDVKAVRNVGKGWRSYEYYAVKRAA